METIEVISLMLGAAWASGINLYAAILVLGWMGGAGHVDLPPGLEVLSDPTVMLAAGGMYVVEFFTDKIPGVDTGWDALHTFIRIPAGALMAAGAAQGLDMGQAGELIGLLLGGGVSRGQPRHQGRHPGDDQYLTGTRSATGAHRSPKMSRCLPASGRR